MKTWTVLLGLTLTTPALAQSWEVEDLGRLTLVGCYGKQAGVYCDFSFTLTKKQTSNLRWYPRDFKVFKQDGTSQAADKVAFIDDKFMGNFDGSSKEIIANVPLKVQVYFNVPNSIAGFRALDYNDIKFDNIPVRPFGKAPTTPAALPAGSNVKGFNISLSNCQMQGQNYVCTATLTPTK